MPYMNGKRFTCRVIMARQFDFKKVAFIRMKLCALLHTAGDERIAKTMHAVTSGGRARAAGAMKAYEQFIGNQ